MGRGGYLAERVAGRRLVEPRSCALTADSAALAALYTLLDTIRGGGGLWNACT